MAPLNVVGHPTTRIDAVERVSGKAMYTRDVRLPGMLYASVLRSPHPHARIRSIDFAKAMALPGVKAVLTHLNSKVVWGAGSVAGGVQYDDENKRITKQRRYIFNNPVRFVGEPVRSAARATDDASLGSDTGRDRAGGHTGDRSSDADPSTVHDTSPT